MPASDERIQVASQDRTLVLQINSAQLTAVQGGGALVLAGLNRNIRHAFELLRLDQILEISAAVPSALEQLQAGS